MKLIIDIPDEDYTAVRCEALYYIGSDKLAESVTTAFQTAIPYEEPTGDLISRDILKESIKRYASSNWLIPCNEVLRRIDNASAVDITENGYCDTCNYNGGYPSSEICDGCKDFNRYKKGGAE